MSLTLTWDDHNRLAQADMPHAYDAGDTGREDNQQTVVEWRWRADPGDPWGAPTINIITAPPQATYTPPGAGQVQIIVYSTRNGITSWQQHVGVFPVDAGGEIVLPATRITETDDRRVTETGDVRITEG